MTSTNGRKNSQNKSSNNKASGNNKLAIIIVILVAVFGLCYFYYQKQVSVQQLGQAQNRVAEVDVAEIITKNVRRWHEFSGRLMAVDYAVISPRVTGMIETINFKNGENVKQDQLLVTLDEKPFVAELKKAEGSYEAAKATQLLAKNDFNRADKLFAAKAISGAEFDKQKSNLDAANAALETARATVDLAKLNLEYSKIRAPIAGKIGRAEITAGNLVNANSSLLTNIVSYDPIYVDFEIDEATYLKFIKSGKDIKSSKEDANLNKNVRDSTRDPKFIGPEMEIKKSIIDKTTPKIPVNIALDVADGKYNASGVIEAFDNVVNPQSGTIRARAVIENSLNILVPGLFVKVALGSQAESKEILISDKAVSTDQNKKFVMVVDKDSKAVYREIKIGEMFEGLRIVESGLDSGDKIIVNGLQMVQPNASIKANIVPMIIENNVTNNPSKQGE